MIRLVMILFSVVEGGSSVPVAIRSSFSSLPEVSKLAANSASGSLAVSCEGWRRLKYKHGTLPQITGPMNDATAVLPGCKYRSNLCTLLGVLPAWLKMGLMTSRRGPHCMMSSSLLFSGAAYSDDKVIEALTEVNLCSWRRRENREVGIGRA